MQLPPLSVIEAWPTPNYIDPITRGNSNLIINYVLYTVLFAFVVLRIFTRTILRSVFGADDAFILLAVIPTTVFFIISVLSDEKFLWIRHQYDIPVDHVTTGLKMVLSAQLMFAVACTLTKLSMLMLVRRMLASATLFWRRITTFAIIIVSVQGSVFCITVIFQCRPPQDYWKMSVGPQPTCINQGTSLLIAGIINTFTDLLVVLLPMRTVWSLQMPLRQMIIIIILFGCGFVSCGAGISRTYYMYQVTQTWDQVWASYPVWMTSAIELYVGVICASIPASRPFFSIYMPKFFGSLPSIHVDSRRRSRRRSAMAPSSGVVITAGGDEELMGLEKALAISHKQGFVASTSTITTKGESSRESEENYIRITQTVDQVSAGTS